MHPGNQVSGTRKVIKMHRSHGTVHSPSTWSPELLGPGKCKKPRACFGEFPCRATWSLSSVDQESTCTPHEMGQTQCGSYTASTPQHASDICLQCSSLPTAQQNQLAQISDHLHPLVSGQKLDIEETCKQRKPKQTNNREPLWK